MWIMSVLFIVKVTLWFHHITSAATHVTAYGLRVIQSSEFTKMRSCLHDYVPIAKKSIPIRIETQVQGFTEDRTVIFPG